MISIIFSTYNETKLPFFEKSLKLLSQYEEIEVICVDKYSTDGTTDIITQYGAKLISTSANSRADRQNIGIDNSSGTFILLHHPRSTLTKEGIDYLLKVYPNLSWGGFTHCFDDNNLILKFTSWYSNNVRGTIREILYLDHCIFAQKSLLKKIGNVPSLEIFEDTALSENLAKKAPLKIIPFPSETSAIRFKSNGVFKQAIMNQFLKLAYLWNFDNTSMNKVYEKDLNLNSKYE